MSREAFLSLAPLFAWPDASYVRHSDGARAAAGAVDRRAARALDAFAREVGRLDPAAREVTYTATFDLAPSCSPYLGEHVFPEDNQRRARLMAGLRASCGTPAEPELPDHVALVLASAERFTEDEWQDLLRLVLAPALERMEGLLSGTSNPYRHLISAARMLSRAAAREGVHA